MDKLIIILPKERAIGWNGLYSGRMKWIERKDIAIHTHELFLEHKARYRRLGKKPFENPVTISVTAYFNRFPLDPDNIASKFYIDGLKGWLLVDDSSKYVRRVITESKDDVENRIEISIEPDSI